MPNSRFVWPVGIRKANVARPHNTSPHAWLPDLEAQRSGPITAEVGGSSPTRPTTTRQPFYNANGRRPVVRLRTQPVPVRSFNCVIERGRLRDADHRSARGAGEQMRFGAPDHAWR